MTVAAREGGKLNLRFGNLQYETFSRAYSSS